MNIAKLWPAPQGLHIEPADARDTATITRLHAEGFYRGWPAEEFAAAISGHDTPIYVACDATRRVAGFIMLRLAADEAEVISIAVDRKWRGKGVGRALLRAALADLMMTAAKRLFLEVAEDNTAATKLYRREGFAEVGKRAGYYPRPDGSPATALVMARDLG